jgi:2-oxo-hept-3-ene-1,7-dioate hydratase
MTSSIDHAQLADELDQARRRREPIRQLSLRYPEITVPDAYGIQSAWIERMRSDSRVVIGRKVGLTSKPMQRAMGISEPDYGVLTDDMAYPTGGDVPHGLFVYPRVEAELAFVLAQRLEGPGVTAKDVLNATSHISPALEILDSRVEMTDPQTGHRRAIVDTIADNAANAGIVVGAELIAPEALRPRDVSVVLYVNGVIEESGISCAVLGNPALAVAWLANKLAEYGQVIEPGEIVLSGAPLQSVPVRQGDVVHADFGTLGAVTCRFV